jgi:hypothetical protein
MFTLGEQPTAGLVDISLFFYKGHMVQLLDCLLVCACDFLQHIDWCLSMEFHVDYSMESIWKVTMESLWNIIWICNINSLEIP